MSRALTETPIGATILWCVESLAPLYGYEKHRLRRALPNIALTVLLVVTNLALSVITAAVANFGNNERLGLLFVLAMPSWLTALFGIMALDLFTYFAHVLSATATPEKEQERRCSCL